MTFRILSWLAAAALSCSVGVTNAQQQTKTTTALPDEVIAQMSDTCAPPTDDSRGLVPQHYSLDDARSGDLWLAVCNVGAYQTTYEVIYQADDAAPRKLLFAQWRNGSWTGTDVLYDPSFDPDTGVLTDQYKDRGAGGCGGERTWQWENGYFRLTEYRAAEACNHNVSELPVIFEAE
ncbi:DUF1176 domain-containing protein [Chromohalobacter sp. 48-RD10]|uniref:DUF1176 domain-containing protein n=1 Tax=Chromohalobacter sp. 48-RD10 TaxID=2994063 RepID=UPI002468608B|nr:DUF1176 domain-containing protein [Chromohalobacter sp. 48-RD10]